MSEDKMREEFEHWFKASKYCQVIYRNGGHEVVAYDGWKACAAIKDAEIADITQRKDKYFLEMCEVIEKNEKLLEEIAARDLMIKELRDVLHNINCNWDEMHPEDIEKVITEALAKSEHHNTSALEKMLLEAELKGIMLNEQRLARTQDIEAKLAELNKE